jgi:hypothetical protein
MNWDAIGATGETLAAITVVITLFFVLKQLRVNNRQVEQANQLARANSQRDILKQVAEHATLTISDEKLQSDIRSCYDSWIDAQTTAKWNFEGWASSYFYIVEQAVDMHDNGLLSDETYHAMESAALRIIETPGGAQWWERKSRIIGAQISKRINERRDTTASLADSTTDG